MRCRWFAGVLGLAMAPVHAQSFDYHLQARALANGVYVVEGANADFSRANGCNIINTGFIVTGAGVVVINTGPSKRYGEQLRALIGRTTAQPVVQVLHLNQHPDYFMGSEAFADVPRLATPATRAAMKRDAASYEDNLYRLCGDWLSGTQALLPTADAKPGRQRIGEHEIELAEFSGHTGSDLVLVDRSRGIGFAGGLVFSQRIPTTPHARIGPWLESLRKLDELKAGTLVPSHGPVAAEALAGTRGYLRWLDDRLRNAARQGWEMNELIAAPMPAEYRAWAAAPVEYQRSVVHLYPMYEREVLQPSPP